MAPGGTPEAGGQGAFSSLLMLGMMFFIFYFLLIRPQQKRQKEHGNFVKGLERGREIVTDSGIFGKIVGLTDTVATIEVSPNTTIKIERSRVTRYRDNESASAE